ncbi:MAG: hypothetical protein QM813_08475 [Verrucomicrobiota bacterium]
MNLRSNYTPVWFWAVLFGLCLGNVGAALADEAKFEAQLVWATADEHPPQDDYKPVDEATQKKLESLGLKWKRFYLVKKTEFQTKNGESGKISLSEKSAISVKLLDDKKVDVVLFGKKGEQCTRNSQPLKAGEILAFGSNVPEKDTAWLIALKRLK